MYLMSLKDSSSMMVLGVFGIFSPTSTLSDTKISFENFVRFEDEQNADFRHRYIGHYKKK